MLSYPKRNNQGSGVGEEDISSTISRTSFLTTIQRHANHLIYLDILCNFCIDAWTLRRGFRDLTILQRKDSVVIENEIDRSILGKPMIDTAPAFAISQSLQKLRTCLS